MDRPEPRRISQAAHHDPPPIPATSPDDVARVMTEARARNAALGLYLWLVVVAGVRRGELCGLQLRDVGPRPWPGARRLQLRRLTRQY